MSYWEVLKIVLEKKSVFLIFLIAFFYLALAAYIMNYLLVFNTILGEFPLSYKFSLLLSLFLGLKSALSVFDFYLLVLTSVLFGVNLILIIKTIEMIKAALIERSSFLEEGVLLPLHQLAARLAGFLLYLFLVQERV